MDIKTGSEGGQSRVSRPDHLNANQGSVGRHTLAGPGGGELGDAGTPPRVSWCRRDGNNRMLRAKLSLTHDHYNSITGPAN